MTLDERTRLTAADTDAVLARNETGVLSLARGDEPYAIPISYGYDAADRQFYVRLVSTPESEKRAFLSASARARFVVYEERDDVYRSVVATGALESVPRGELTVGDVEQYGDAERPLFEVWEDPRQDLDVALYRLDPDELSGRRVVVDRERDAA